MDNNILIIHPGTPGTMAAMAAPGRLVEYAASFGHTRKVFEHTGEGKGWRWWMCYAGVTERAASAGATLLDGVSAELLRRAPAVDHSSQVCSARPSTVPPPPPPRHSPFSL